MNVVAVDDSRDLEKQVIGFLYPAFRQVSTLAAYM